MLATVGAVSATRAADLCSSTGPILLIFAWVLAPIVAIASITTIAVITDNAVERFVAVVLAVAFTGAWLFALIWASVGEAILRSSC